MSTEQTLLRPLSYQL